VGAEGQPQTAVKLTSFMATQYSDGVFVEMENWL
jgi:hypothetical protein